MTYREALDTLSREERFMATVYAMNTWLSTNIRPYAAEFERLFVEWAEKHQGVDG